MSTAIALWCGVLLAGFLSISQCALVLLVLAAFTFTRKRAIPLLLIALLLGASIYAIRESAQSNSLITHHSGEKLTIIARVTSDPHEMKSRVIGSHLSQNRISFLARSQEIIIGGNRYKTRVPLRILASDSAIRNGELREFSGRALRTDERRVASLVISEGASQLIAPSNLISEKINALRNRFVQLARAQGSKGSSLIPGLVIGDTRLEPPNLIDDMRQSGLTHLTAVSGANFAIVIAFVLWATSWFIPRKSQRAFLATIFIGFFVALVRPSPSVLRAAVMALVVIIAKVRGTRSTSASSLAIAIFIVIAIDPYQAFDPGFVLSVLATGGLIFLAPQVQQRFERFLKPALAEAISVTLSATLTCAPYLLFLAGSLSLGTVFFNIAVAMAITPITILGFLSLITLPISSTMSRYLFSLAEPLASWIAHVASLHSAVRNISLTPTLFLLSAIALLIGARRGRIALVSTLCLILAVSISGYLNFPGSKWKIGQCDVGQGDALLINLGDSSAILIDAGPDPLLLTRCLKEFRITNLPLVILTHDHADHFQGITGSLPASIGEVWISHEGSVTPARFHKLRVVRAGFRAKIKEATLKVLWPGEREGNFATIHGDGSLENNRSIVVEISLDGIKILATGDIEPGAQEEILSHRSLEDLSDISILKVPHHGSRYQSLAFLTQIQPVVSLISVGKGNSYGHPSAHTIHELIRLGSRVYRTDRDGALSLSWRREESLRQYVFSARTIGRQWWRVRWL